MDPSGLWTGLRYDRTKELEDAWQTDMLEGALWVLPRLTILVQSLSCPLFDDERHFLHHLLLQKQGLSPQSKAAITEKLDQCSKNYLPVPGLSAPRMLNCAQISAAVPKLIDDLKSRQYQKWGKAQAELVKLAYEADATGCGMCVILHPLIDLTESNNNPGAAHLAEQLLGSYPMSARRKSCESQRRNSGFGLIGGSWICPGLVPTVGGKWFLLPDLIGN